MGFSQEVGVVQRGEGRKSKANAKQTIVVVVAASPAGEPSRSLMLKK
jgi:hypothetical protein